MPKVLLFRPAEVKNQRMLTVKRHGNMPVHVPVKPTLAQAPHVHYKNTCPSCQKVTQCTCEADFKLESKHVCNECLGLASQPEKSASLVGKIVGFVSEGVKLVGKAIKASREGVSVRLAVPSNDGVLILTDSEMLLPASELSEISDALTCEKKVRAFDHTIPFTLDGKGTTVTDENKVVRDYRDLTIAGFASTFQTTTPSDRDGDYIMAGAFDRSLTEFRQNPVMLTDHCNSVENLIGSYTKIGVNDQGLAVQGKLSNSPDLVGIRFLVAEGHLKAFSIGGFFIYAQDGRGIEEVRLYEISLVPIPANPDSLISQTRKLTIMDAAKCWTAHAKKFRKN